MKSTMSNNTLILPKGADSQELQKIIEANPDIGSTFNALQTAASKVSLVELKYILNKMGIRDESTRFTFEEFVRYIIAPYQPDMGELYSLHMAWIHMIEEEYPDENVSIAAPVDSWKSTILAVNYPLYLMYITEGLVRIGAFSAGEDLSKKRIIQCREAIEGNPRLQAIGVQRPARSSDWGETSFTVVRNKVISGSTMKAFGIGGQSQGFKFDYISLDDVVSRDNSRTETNRKNLEEKFRREVISRLSQEPPPPLTRSRAVAIWTAFHKDDLNHKLGRGFESGNVPTFMERRYKAIYEESEIDEAPEFVKKQIRDGRYKVRNPDTGEMRTIGLVFPERLSYKRLMREKNSQGPKYFAQNYLQVPATDEDYAINPEWIRSCFDPSHVMGPELWWNYFARRGFKLFLVLDPAVTRSKKQAQKKDRDYWVMEARCYSQQHDLRVILDYRRGRGILKRELLDETINFYNSFLGEKGDPTKIVAGAPARISPIWNVEDNSAQDWLVQDMEDIFGKSHVRGLLTTHISKNDGFIGLPAVSYAFETKKVLIPTGNARSLAYAELLCREAEDFGTGSGHDDIMDCQLINEQAIGKLRGVIKNLNPALLGFKKRGPRSFGNIPTPAQRYRSRARMTR